MSNENKVPEYIQRMQKELDELHERIEKANNFIEKNPQYSKLSDYERDMLFNQVMAMIRYAYCLNKRIAFSLRK